MKKHNGAEWMVRLMLRKIFSPTWLLQSSRGLRLKKGEIFEKCKERSGCIFVKIIRLIRTLRSARLTMISERDNEQIDLL